MSEAIGLRLYNGNKPEGFLLLTPLALAQAMVGQKAEGLLLSEEEALSLFVRSESLGDGKVIYGEGPLPYGDFPKAGVFSHEEKLFAVPHDLSPEEPAPLLVDEDALNLASFVRVEGESAIDLVEKALAPQGSRPPLQVTHGLLLPEGDAVSIAREILLGVRRRLEGLEAPGILSFAVSIFPEWEDALEVLRGGKRTVRHYSLVEFSASFEVTKGV